MLTPIASLGTQGLDDPAFGNGHLYFYVPSAANNGTAQLMMVDTTAQTPSVMAIGSPETEPEVLFVDQ